MSYGEDHMSEQHPPESKQPDRGTYGKGHWEQEKEREKEEEKEREKEQEKEREKEEKNWDEKWRRDPVSALGWALVLIWVGVVLLLSNVGALDRFEGFEAWNLVFLGAGIILLLQIVYRLLVPEHRRPVLGAVILAVIFLSIGLGGLASAAIIWPTVIILLGVFVLVRGLSRKR